MRAGARGVASRRPRTTERFARRARPRDGVLRALEPRPASALRGAYAAELQADDGRRRAHHLDQRGHRARPARPRASARATRSLIAADEHPGLTGPARHAARASTASRSSRRRCATSPTRSAPATTLVACSHVSWTTGALAPLDALRERPPGVAAAARRRPGRRRDRLRRRRRSGCDFYAARARSGCAGRWAWAMLWIGPSLPRSRRSARRIRTSPTPGRPRPTPTPAVTTRSRIDLATLETGARRARRARRPATGARPPSRWRPSWPTRSATGRVVPRDATTLVAWDAGGDPAAERERLAAAGVVGPRPPGTPVAARLRRRVERRARPRPPARNALEDVRYSCAPPGRLAQLGERLLDKQEVTGSSPVSPTFRKPRNREGFVVPGPAVVATRERSRGPRPVKSPAGQRPEAHVSELGQVRTARKPRRHRTLYHDAVADELLGQHCLAPGA